MDKKDFTEEELQICACIKKIIRKYDKKVNKLKFIKTNAKYIEGILYSVPFLKFKVTENEKYIIISKEKTKEEYNQLLTRPCTFQDGGKKFIRVYFSSLIELECLNSYIIDKYKYCKKYHLLYPDEINEDEFPVIS